VGYQWLGEGVPRSFSHWDLGPVKMLKETRKLLQEADIIVGKNSVKFDYRWIQTEFLKYDINPPKLPSHVDLEKTARSQFRFLSNKLDYILQYLGMGNKMDTGGFKLWKEVIEGDAAARRKMVKYCLQDVRQTGRLYYKMLPYINNHPALRSLGSEACPNCLSKKTKKDGIRRTACFHIQQHQCLNCGKYFSGKRTKVV
jgi:DNA polymerase III epsilon subunit-like protein